MQKGRVEACNKESLVQKLPVQNIETFVDVKDNSREGQVFLSGRVEIKEQLEANV
jgi:hypothetical protein